MKHALLRWNHLQRLMIWLAALLAMTCLAVQAEQLPAKTYTTADGLVGDSVVRVVPDGRGFIWFCTLEGLSRFDGYGFTNYTTADGLPDRHVNDLLVTRRGDYWLATDSGLARLNPKGQPALLAQKSGGVDSVPLFTVYQPDQAKGKLVNVLFEDQAGIVWVGTAGGLYQLEAQGEHVGFRAVALSDAGGNLNQSNVTGIASDHQGALWVGTDRNGLFRLLADGRSEHYTTQQGLPTNSITALLADAAGQMWAGAGVNGGLVLLSSEPDLSLPVVAHLYTKRDGLPSDWVMSLYQAADGRLLIGTPGGLCQLLLRDLPDHPDFSTYGAQQGLCDAGFSSITEDRDSNLWVASRCGASKIARYGFTRFTLADGLGSTNINSIFETQAGTLYVSTYNAAGARIVNQFDGDRFTATNPRLPANSTYGGWGWKQTVLQDHLGAWWIPTNGGLFRFPAGTRFDQLAHTAAQELKIARTGNEIFRLYEDAHGDIWIATTGNGTDLMRWERATESWHDYTQAAGLSPERIGASFIEDRAGNLWIGTGGEDSALLRYRDDRVTVFTHADGAPRGWLKDLYLDHAGRLWIASNVDGLIRVDDPSAARPQFVAYTIANGLASNNVLSVTEDNWGRIYAGTGRALDQLDPQTGRVRHYTSADGLPNSKVDEAFRDRQGTLWFGTSYGLARLAPEPERPRQAPLILITGVRVDGLARAVSALGETALPQLRLSPAETQVSVDFLGLGASLGEELRYEYQLEGADVNWAQSRERTVNFANLAPGAYRLMVRAVNAEGLSSQTPASVGFVIAVPLWRRGWFIALTVLGVAGLAYALYRYRVARLLDVERMRTRIASDLHDDIGANLTKIAILSEVARQQFGSGDATPDAPLPAIARISRESVAAMGDIVWAINPQRDTLRDLVRRMRSHAEELFTSRDIGLTFNAPAPDERLKLSVDVRRDLFLIFKEAVNNTARHARCTQVLITLATANSRLLLEIADDGVGFEPTGESDGQGLVSMRRRAAHLGGTLEIESATGRGTRIRIDVPYVGRARARAERRAAPYLNP